ncbi:bacterial cell division membrane protein [Anaerolinea thermolimosa]|nr:FtsW/RodA/SpoVE family cell cycle protein [Anaerolinea thermolimosa]GAP05686.1 bacterial cell division membrane protein [Anaerolinea thermolimosa]
MTSAQPISPARPTPHELQFRLMFFTTGFILLFAISLSLSPIVRLRNWQAGLLWVHWVGVLIWAAGFWLIFREISRLPHPPDPFLLPIMGLLSGWGVLTIFRLSTYLGLRQAIWLGVGLGLFWASLRFTRGLSFLRRYKYIWLFSGLLLTALTLLFGAYPGGEGPRLWLGCCGVYFQPSEPLKLLLVIFLAAYLADRLPYYFSLFNLLAPSLVLIGLALALLIVQRDLGTATLLILVSILTLYLASGKKRVLFFGVFALLVAGWVGYRFSDVVHTRIQAFLNPWADPGGSSYQVIQSLLAVASGGLFGRGPGLGSPGLVPVAASDFIYPAIVEETGLLGGVAVLLLFFLLVIRALIIAVRAPYRFHRFLAGGVAVYFATQMIMIIGGNIRLLPLTGVTLPFLSYGGSSLLTSIAAVLLLVHIHRESVETDPAPLPSPFPYSAFALLLAMAVFFLAFVTGWYAVIRQDALLTRTDNPRRSITDRYVLRGSLLDRSNQPITTTTGVPGSYQRVNHYPPLSPVIGYSHPVYGQAGIEAFLDDTLRGLKGNPALDIWWNRLLYGEPPPGLDVRLSLDLNLQKAADDALGEHAGAIVLLNARTGEILVMASHPYFDPNTLSDTWPSLITDPESPLLNRAVQGLYPPGAAIAPVILGEALGQSDLPDLPRQLTYTLPDGKQLTCAVSPADPPSWGNALASGCPAPLALLGNRFLPVNLDRLFQRYGFSTLPSIPLAVAPAVVPPVSSVTLASLGQNGMLLSPLQMAEIAAAVSNDGALPAPQLTLAVLTPRQGWVIVSESQTQQVMSANRAQRIAQLLASPGKLYWQVTASTTASSHDVTWFLAGTLTQWKGSPLALAVLLEENNPPLAQSIGETILDTALNSN